MGTASVRRPVIGGRCAVVTLTATSCRAPWRAAGPGPLVAPTAGHNFFTFSDREPGDRDTLATLTMTNRGGASLTLDSVTLVGAKNIRLIGVLAGDTRRVSPGLYASFPPTPFQPDLRTLSDLPPIRPGGSVLLFVGLSLIEAAPGTVTGVAATYRAGGHTPPSGHRASPN